MSWVIPSVLFVVLLIRYLHLMQKSSSDIAKAYRDGFSDACNMEEPNYDYLSPLNAGIIRDRIELGLSSGFNYTKTKLYKKGWEDSRRQNI